MIRCLAPMIGLVASLIPALIPALAHAQTNIDQGKSPAQIFAIDCAECHKAPHGLANGRNSAALADFLREHYTTSREQAAALAAYVLGGRSAETGGTATQTRNNNKKPAAEPAGAAATAEEPKPSKNSGRQTAKPEDEEGKPVAARPQPPADGEAKPRNEANRGSGPGQVGASASQTDSAAGSEDGRRERSATTAARGRHKEPKTVQPAQEPAVAHAPAAVVAEPVSAAASKQDASPAAPADAAASEPGESAPVPRDNIPD